MSDRTHDADDADDTEDDVSVSPLLTALATWHNLRAHSTGILEPAATIGEDRADLTLWGVIKLGAVAYQHIYAAELDDAGRPDVALTATELENAMLCAARVLYVAAERLGDTPELPESEMAVTPLGLLPKADIRVSPETVRAAHSFVRGYVQ